MTGAIGVGRFEARILTEGSIVGSGGFFSKVQQLFSPKDQLCVFDQTRNAHIASGVSKSDFKALVAMDTRKAMSSQNLEISERILASAGIPANNLSPADKVRYAVLVAFNPTKAVALATLANNGIAEPERFSDSFRDTLVQISASSPDSARELAALHLAAGAETSTVSQAKIETMGTITKSNPVLGGKLMELARGELAGREEEGVTNYMVDRSGNDVFLADPRTTLPRGVQVPNNLGFTPKFHVPLNDADYTKMSALLGRLQGDGLFGQMQLDAGTNTLHIGYTYQGFSDQVGGASTTVRAGTTISPRHDGDTMKNMLRDLLYNAPENARFQEDPLGSLLERAFGNPQFSKDRQDTRFDAIKAMFNEYEHFDYETYDHDFNSLVQDSLDEQFGIQTSQQNVDYLLGILDYPGLTISEEHSSGDSKAFLYNNLATLKANGVNVVMIEHLKQAEVGDMIDSYMATPPGTPMPGDLRAILASLDRGKVGAESISGLVTKIHDDPACAGMRLVCGDTENNNPSRDPVHMYEVRMGAMNMVAEKNLRSALQPGEKFVILAGGAHNNTHVGLTHGMPGFAQVFNIPAISVHATDSGDFTMTLDREKPGKRTAATQENRN